MPSTPVPAEKEAEIKDLAQSIRQAIDAEISELAEGLATTDGPQPFGANEFKLRDIAHRIAARAVERHLAGKKTATAAPR